ncbi:MAG TPA: DUF4476 domain-containing protein [Flavisolibacter sp.]|nr:DUF4476 domain-containing protein [Flavisolibacter sp.]
MKKLLLFGFAACLSFTGSAQKVYFLYLQTDDQVPFYVRLSDKVYSSATSGYLILPNLIDSTYNLSFGYAKSTQPETRFAVSINQNDKGYLIKNFAEGLALFDMQELSLVKSVSGNKDNTVYETKSDKFSAVLSKAADDPGLLKVPVAKKEEPKSVPEQKNVVTVKAEEIKPIEEKPRDTVAAKPIETVEGKVEKKEEAVAKVDNSVTKPETKTVEDVKQPAVKEEPLTNDAPKNNYRLSVIRRHSESSTTEGFGIVYFDRIDDRVDTIRILIPPSKGKIDEDAQTANLSEIKKKEETVIAESQQLKVDPEVKAIKEKPAPVSITLSSCQNNASEKDFMKLRKNMAAKSNDEEMIAEAKKSFKNKCFTSEQIRYLSTLFLTSAAKYQFFDAAYNYVSDKQSFSSLQSEMKDEYYLKRFKALIGE